MNITQVIRVLHHVMTLLIWSMKGLCNTVTPAFTKSAEIGQILPFPLRAPGSSFCEVWFFHAVNTDVDCQQRVWLVPCLALQV